VLSVKRIDLGVELTTAQGTSHFDRVIFATHVPTVRKILSMTVNEAEVLGSFQVETNHGVLHQDTSTMPQKRRCWASWNVAAAESSDSKKVSLTYFLNRLQPINSKNEYFLTLNPSSEIQGPTQEFSYDHPRFDRAAIKAQQELSKIQGHGGVFFTGAWTRYGFHEDGLLSAVQVARLLGVETPWKIT
jgi:uncharacterized protein